MRGEILDSLRNLDTATRNGRNFARRREAALSTLEAALGRMPDSDEIAAHLQMSKATYLKWERKLVTGESGVQLTPPPTEDVLAYEPVPTPTVLDEMIANETIQIFTAALNSPELSRRQRDMLRWYLIDGKPLGDVARRYGISKALASVLIRKACAVIRELLEKQGVDYQAAAQAFAVSKLANVPACVGTRIPSSSAR